MDSCGQLPGSRESLEELVALDEPALGGISKVKALWTFPCVPREGTIHHPTDSAQV